MNEPKLSAAAEALRESEERLRGTFENAAVGIAHIDRSGRFLRVNEKYCTLVGYSREELLQMNLREIIHPDHLPAFLELYESCFARNELPPSGMERRYLRKDGSSVWVEVVVSFQRDLSGRPSYAIGVVLDISERKRVEEELRQANARLDLAFVSMARDISERKRVEEALRQANARLDLAMRGSNLAIWEISMPDGNIQNGELTLTNVWESLGYDAPTAPTDLPSLFALLFDPDEQARVGRELEELFAGAALEYESEYRVRKKDGSIRWLLARGTVLRDPEGKPVRFIGTSADITDMKRAEEALRASERRFRVFVDHAADAFFLTDERGRILDANQSACESLGYTRDDLIGMTPFDFVSELNPTGLYARIRQLLAGETIAVENVHRRKDGTAFPVEVRSKAFWEGTQAFFVGLARDISERKRLEEQVHLATARLELALRGSNIATWDIDMPDGDVANGHIHYVNMWEQLGYERSGFPKDLETGIALIYPDDRAAHAEAIRRYLVGDSSEFEVEIRVRHRDGSLRWMMFRGVAVRDAGGKPIRFLGTGIDVTDRKRADESLRESEERFRQLAANVQGVFWLEEGGWQRLLYISPAYETVWGRTTQSFYEQPRSWIDTVHPDDRNLVLASLERQNRGEHTATEFRIARPDGSIRWVHCSAFPMRNQTGEVYRAAGLVEDITERRQIDEELRRAKEAAEAANRAKDDFLANVSHEIRTPMNAIIGMTELVLDTPLNNDQRRGLKTVKSAADSLLAIINDLLDFSKIEAGKLELAPADFSLRSVVGETLRALAVRAHTKGLELIHEVQPDVPDALVGDAGRLRQVLLNLAGNAVKFTDQGEVLVRVETEGGGRTPTLGAGEVGLRFTVLDTGIGIPPDQQARIFRAFEQEDISTTRKYGGTGLGLTIASQLIALMGGTITVDSAPGRGSTFAFRARFGQQPHSPEASRQSPVSLHNLPVLVIDDNATNRHILAEWLRGWQLDPTVVCNGMAAMDALRQCAANGRPYALVLLDARMPDADGLAVAVMIRETAEHAAIPIILLTSGERPGEPARFRELAIDAQLLKPVQQDELLETICQLMNRAQGGASLPARPAPAEHPPLPLPTTTPLSILVAEDNVLSALVLEQGLAARGHRVRVASDGREVLALAEQGGFDLLLLDVHMPGLDGFQVVEAVRERERTTGGHLPIIALTARSRKEDRGRCLAAGMDDFQTKPIGPADLLAAIDRVLQTHSSC
jgi:two-component system, sensor histidine kinase and response regulator